MVFFDLSMFKTCRNYCLRLSAQELKLSLSQVDLTPALTMEVMMMYVVEPVPKLIHWHSI